MLGQSNSDVFEILADQMSVHYYHLHQYPELSLQEKNTSSYLKNQLEPMGFSFEGPFGGYGFAAVYSNGDGPVIWIRADMDALPVKETTGISFASEVTSSLADGTEVSVMHACGHDMHMAVWLGTAKYLTSHLQAWKGTVVFVAQPAEEFGDGARKMINDGLFQQLPAPDYVIALHVSAAMEAGTIGYVPGFSYANVDAMNIKVFGVGGHGAYPHTTIDPVVLASRIVLGLQTLVSRRFSPLEPLVITVGAIHGGNKGNVIPNEVNLQLTIRYHNESLRSEIISSIRLMTEGLAHSAGLSEELYPQLEYYPENLPGVYNDPELTSRLAEAWIDGMKEGQVKKGLASMGGEDFGRFGTTSQQVPISIFWLGAVDLGKMNGTNPSEWPSLHSSEFLPDTKKTLVTGIQAMSIAALELLR